MGSGGWGVTWACETTCGLSTDINPNLCLPKRIYLVKT